MFGFTSYISKLHQIEWHFPNHMLDAIGQDLFVTFTAYDDHFKINEVLYSYIDILMGLEGYNFTINKIQDVMTITIHSPS